MDFHFLYQGQRFVWNLEKAAANVAKHGIRFEAACQVFLDPLVEFEDATASLNPESESREAAIGMSKDWKVVYVVHVVRENGLIRIISAREATPYERRRYENNE